MTEKKIIVTDLDDTICNTEEEIIKYAIDYHINTLQRTNPINKRVSCMNYYYFKDMLEWNDKDTIGFFEKYYPQYLLNIKCKRGVAAYTSKLKSKGYDIHICSARRSISNDYVFNLTKNWLEGNGIIFDKLLIDQVDKLSYVKKIENVIFIDDSFENCQSVAQYTNHMVCIFDTKYNQGFQSDGIFRVYNWKEIYKLLVK